MFSFHINVDKNGIFISYKCRKICITISYKFMNIGVVTTFKCKVKHWYYFIQM